MNTAPIRKSLVAAAGAGFFAAVAGLAAGMADGDLTRPEGVIAAGLGLAALAATGRATWRVPNDPT